MKMDEDLAAVHAYLCADGYVVKNPETQKQKYYRLGLRSTNEFLLRDFQERFERYFGIKPRLVLGQRSEIGSREIYERLTKEFGSFYSWEWKMPKLDKELSKIWLRAYFDCEGWVTCKSHQNRHIGAECVNEEGLNQVKNALKDLEIESSIKKRSTRNIFSLQIYGKENIVRFSEKIGFLSHKKLEKLKEALDDFVVYDWIFPEKKEELAKFIKNLMRSKGRIKRDNGIIRLISKKEENLLRLQKELNRLFEIDSKVNSRINGLGTVYFELSINKQSQVKYLIDKNFISDGEKEKWKILPLRR